jgi:hypothetical protein
MWERTLFVAGVLLSGCTASAPIRTPAPHPPTTLNAAWSSSHRPAVVSSLHSLPQSGISLPQSTTAGVSVDQVDLCARQFVEAVLRADLASARRLADVTFVESVDAWIDAAVNAEVIDVVVLSSAGGRSRIGVGVAFEQAVDGTITEPIAYIVDIQVGVEGCRVIGLGFA